MGSSSHKRNDAGWIDISVPVRSGMVRWPSDPDVRIERLADIGRGDAYNLSWLTMGAHCGTHIDAPLHLLAGRASMDDLPLTAMIGRARVIEVGSVRSVGPDDLRPHAIEAGDRVLLKTGNSRRCWSTDAFVEDYVSLSQTGAQYLADRGVQAVGIDYLSIGEYGPDGDATHKILMWAGVWIIEGLDLSKAVPGLYELICLPLRLLGAEGAPARAVLRPIGPG